MEKSKKGKDRKGNFREFLREYAWICQQSLQYKWEIGWYVLMGIFGTVMGLAGSILSKYIIDAVTGYDSSLIVTALVFYALMQLFRIGTNALSNRIGTRISIRVHQKITGEVFDKVLRSDWEAVSQFHSGDLLTRVNGDVSTVSASVLGWFPDLVTRAMQFAGTLGVILYYDRTLALLALVSAPVTLLISRYAIKMMRHHNKKMRQITSDTTVFNEESFRNMQLLKALDRTDAQIGKHRKIQEVYKSEALEYNRFTIRKQTLMSVVGTVVALVCFGWSVYRLWSGHITYGTMTLFLQLAGGVSAAFSALVGLIPGAIGAATAAGRIMAITQLPPEDLSGKKEAEAFQAQTAGKSFAVEGRGVSYCYEDGRQVLQQVDFKAQAQKITALVGPSGEGKTTLLRLLLGILHPKQGQLELVADGGERIRISPATRPFFTYVPQTSSLFTGTVAENLRLMQPDASEQALFAALELACAADFVRALPQGLHTPIREHGGFSQGQLQRICIARALLSSAPVLLLDEATSALDTETERKILQNIKNTQSQRTCLITSHRPGVLEISDETYYVNQNCVQPASAQQLELLLTASKGEDHGADTQN